MAAKKIWKYLNSFVYTQECRFIYEGNESYKWRKHLTWHTPIIRLRVTRCKNHLLKFSSDNWRVLCISLLLFCLTLYMLPTQTLAAHLQVVVMYLTGGTLLQGFSSHSVASTERAKVRQQVGGWALHLIPPWHTASSSSLSFTLKYRSQVKEISERRRWCQQQTYIFQSKFYNTVISECTIPKDLRHVLKVWHKI